MSSKTTMKITGILLGLVEGSVRRRRRVAVLFALLAAAAAPGLLRLELDNAPEVFFVRDAEELERYRRFQMDFGRDRTVRLVVEGEGLWTREGLAWLGWLEREAQELPGVFGAAGLYRHHHRRPESWPPADPAAFRDAILEDPLDRGAGWVDTDGSLASVLVIFYNLPASGQRRLLRDLEKLLATAPAGLSADAVGLPVVERALDAELVRFAGRIFPLLVLLVGGLLLAVLRSLGDVARLFLLVGAVTGILLGLMGHLGIRLDLVTILLPPLLFVIGLATAVYVLLACRAHRRHGRSPREAVAATYQEKAWPVLWTGVTTLAGFGSLTVSGVPAVRSLGLWSAVGIAWMTLAVFTLYPALLAGSRGVPGRESRFEGWAARRGRGAALWAVHRRRRLVALFGVLALLLLAGALRLRQETDLAGYFPPEHPVRARLQGLEERGIGGVAGDIVLAPRAGHPPPFAGVEGIERLAALTRRLRARPGILGAVGAGDFVLSEGPGQSPAEETLRRLEAEAGSRDFLATLRTRDGERARVVVSVPMRGFEELDPVFSGALGEAGRRFPELEVTLTGRYPLVVAAQRALLRTMVLALALALLIVAVAFRLALGGWRWGLVALLPNLWPVLLVVGAMGWLGVPVDSTTLMIAAVVLGLAVDDTFHTFGRFRRQRAPAAEAAVATLEGVAPAHVLSSVLLAVGFGLCAAAGLVPLARFGALAALGILGALAADLLLVPALLAVRRGGRPV